MQGQLADGCVVPALSQPAPQDVYIKSGKGSAEPLSPNVIIRCDAGPRIGMGHLMRCLALGQEFVGAGARVVFLTVGELGARTLRRHGMEVVSLGSPHPDGTDLATTLRTARGFGIENTLVVVDGYHFEESYLSGLRQAGARVACIDDYGHLSCYAVDALINPNLGSESIPYKTPSSTIRLLGPDYVLLRDDVLQAQRDQAAAQKVCRILVTMGGADPHRVTLQVLDALAKVRGVDLEVTVLCGAAVQYEDELEQRWMQLGLPGRLVVGATSVAPFMATSHLAVSAAGSTAWELAYLGVPALLVVTAENQEGIAQSLEKAGAALCLGWYHTLDVDRVAEAVTTVATCRTVLKAMSRRGRQLVDGWGRKRVVQVLKSLVVRSS